MLTFRLISFKGSFTLAKKQKPAEHTKHVTKRQISRKQKEKRVNRIIVSVAGALVVLAVILIGMSLYFSEIEPMQATVLEVGEQKVDMGYFMDLMKLYVAQSLTQLSQVETSKRASTAASAVLGDIEKNLILLKYAPELGYNVDPKEIDDALSNVELPNKQAYRDSYAGQVLQQRLEDDYFGKNYPTALEQAKVQALVFESKEAAEKGIELYNTGETFTILAQTYGVEKVTKEKGGELGWLPKGLIARTLEMDNADILENNIFKMAPGEMTEPIYDKDIVKGTGYWIVKVEEKDGDISAHVRVILVGTLDEANDVLQKLSEGADFATLAQQVSQHESKDDGGDIGWLNKGMGDNALVTETAFTLSAGEVSQPVHDVAIETKGGYWVIRVVEKEMNRPLDEDLRNSFIQDDYYAWLMEQGGKANIKELMTDAQMTWAYNKIVK